jgi:PAS domain S-box-containing protein
LNKKILIVEDEIDLLDLYYSILSNKKFITADVEKAGTAEKAIELSLNNNYDLILTDYYLPNMDGITLIRNLKEKNPITEFIMISGYLTNDIVENAKTAGALFCIQKPTSMENIINTVKKALFNSNDPSEKNSEEKIKAPVIRKMSNGRKLLVFHINENDNITYCDELFARKIESTQEEITGKSVTEYFHSYFSEYLKKIGKSFIDFAKENIKMKTKLDFKTHESDQRLPLLCEFRVLNNLNSCTCSMMVICTDEEENTKLTKLIQLEKASSKQLLYGQFDMVITLDDKLNIKTINNICEEKLGIKNNDYIGTPIREIINKKQDRMILDKAIKQVNSLNDVFNLRLDIASKNNTIPVLVNIRGVRNDFNNEIGYVLILRDIEKELRMEDTLSNIERMQALGKLAAGMAHQINNYVSSLSGNTDLLEVELKIDNSNVESLLKIVGKYMHKIRTSISRLSGLTKHLTLFARAQQRPVISLGSINRVINDVLSLTELRIIKKHISFNTILDNNIPDTYFSPLHLEQAVLNILMNAIDAVETKNGEICIKTFKEANSACISIKDNGPGIPENVKNKIFDAFVTTKPSGVGTGLGLNVAKDMITSLRGDLKVVSESGVGTEMIIKIPIIKKGDDI